MIDYELSICYGIIVSIDKIEELKSILPNEVYDEFIDNYSRCINSWIGDDYFIGTYKDLPSTIDLVYNVEDISIPDDNDKDWIAFEKFFDKYNLWQFIDWIPRLMLINFCY